MTSRVFSTTFFGLMGWTRERARRSGLSDDKTKQIKQQVSMKPSCKKKEERGSTSHSCVAWRSALQTSLKHATASGTRLSSTGSTTGGGSLWPASPATSKSRSIRPKREKRAAPACRSDAASVSCGGVDEPAPRVGDAEELAWTPAPRACPSRTGFPSRLGARRILRCRGAVALRAGRRWTREELAGASAPELAEFGRDRAADLVEILENE